MIGLSPEAAAKHVLDAIEVTREDIARAKSWILSTDGSNTQGMVDDWLRQQGMADVREVNTDAEDCEDRLAGVARAYSMRLAYYQAAWELISAGILVSCTSTGHWDPPLGYKTSRGGGGIPVKEIGCPYPERIYRLPSALATPTDVDVFLEGVSTKAIHSGILEAVAQSLTCFRRGLYMPATVMLAAAAEATWMECGAAVAANLSDQRLSGIVADSFVGIAKIVTEVRKALESKGAKPLLQKAGLTIHQVVDVEIWTTALRERRNALHWGGYPRKTPPPEAKLMIPLGDQCVTDRVMNCTEAPSAGCGCSKVAPNAINPASPRLTESLESSDVRNFQAQDLADARRESICSY